MGQKTLLYTFPNLHNSHAPGEEGPAFGPNIYMAEQVLKRDVLAIRLSDLHKNLVEPTLDIKD